MATVQFRLNGKSVTLKVAEDRPLLWTLRTDLALTGVKYACGEGLCGACTVLVTKTWPFLWIGQGQSTMTGGFRLVQQILTFDPTFTMD